MAHRCHINHFSMYQQCFSCIDPHRVLHLFFLFLSSYFSCILVTLHHHKVAQGPIFHLFLKKEVFYACHIPFLSQWNSTPSSPPPTICHTWVVVFSSIESHFTNSLNLQMPLVNARLSGLESVQSTKQLLHYCHFKSVALKGFDGMVMCGHKKAFEVKINDGSSAISSSLEGILHPPRWKG